MTVGTSHGGHAVTVFSAKNAESVPVAVVSLERRISGGVTVHAPRAQQDLVNIEECSMAAVRRQSGRWNRQKGQYSE
jgi:hypothetical protein